MQLLTDAEFGLMNQVMRSYAYHDSDRIPHASCGGVERLYNANRELGATEREAKLRQSELQECWHDVPLALGDDAMACVRVALRQINPHYKAVLHAEYRFRGYFKKAMTPAQLMRRAGARFSQELWLVDLTRALAVVLSLMRRGAGDRFDIWFK